MSSLFKQDCHLKIDSVSLRWHQNTLFRQTFYQVRVTARLTHVTADFCLRHVYVCDVFKLLSSTKLLSITKVAWRANERSVFLQSKRWHLRQKLKNTPLIALVAAHNIRRVEKNSHISGNLSSLLYSVYLGPLAIGRQDYSRLNGG